MPCSTNAIKEKREQLPKIRTLAEFRDSAAAGDAEDCGMSDTLKVQFGCGENRLENWINHDMDCDVTKPLPYGDESVAECLAEHILEHISTPSLFRFLCESHRILKPGGSLYISMPVLDRLPKEHAIDMILGHGHEAAYTEQSLIRIVGLSPFKHTLPIPTNPSLFGHWRVIGEEKDNLESFRIQLIK